MRLGVDALEPGLAALVGAELNGIRIEEPIGIGGMGVVFRGYQGELNREVAVKVAHTSLGAEQNTRFLREAKAAAGLDHPNCITVYEFGSHDGTQFMVMPLLRGRPLSALLAQPIPVERAVSMGLQIARGLEHAHGRNVIHRDLKPENVFVVEHDGADLLKIVDFGIAKVVKATAEQGTATMSGLLVRYAGVHEPRASVGPADRSPQRHLLGGDHHVSDADGRSALHRR